MQGPLRILLVEDNPGDAELFSRALAKCGHESAVHHVESRSDAVAAMACQSFDIVLLDLSLPDSKGLTALHQIHGKHPHVPLVILTSLDDHDTALKAIEAGAQDYLIKDQLSPELLERSIGYAIQRQQHAAEQDRLVQELRHAQACLKKKNRRLRRLYQTAQRFVNDVSHEFRTPLTVIMEYVSMMRDGLLGPIDEEQRRYLDIVGVRADDLNTMVDDMLDISRLEAGMMGIHRQDCRIAEVVSHVYPSLARKADVKSVLLETEIPEDLPAVYCDAEKIGRVIMNLVINAIKFCGESGQVRLWASHDPIAHEVVIGITDNGPGIDTEGLQVIFERFRQWQTPNHGSTRGFGLGLNIARELVELNLGHLMVESECGVGSTFSFSVPLAGPAEVARRYTEPSRLRSPKLTLAEVTIDALAGDEDAEEMDMFLAQTLRMKDLLFRTTSRRWLLVLPLVEGKSQMIARIKRELHDMNRNRPRGPLPQPAIRWLGTWDLPDGRNDFLNCFESASTPEELLHA